MADIEDVKDTDIKDVDGADKNPPADELAEYRNADGEFDADKIRKLAEDKKYFRSQISKLKQLPSKLEEYSADFVIDSKFDEFLSDEEHRKNVGDVLARIDTMCLEKGIGVERNHDIKRFILDELANKKVYDLTPAAEKKAREEQIINERNESIQDTIGVGTDIQAWDKNLMDWLKGFCNSDAEFEMHKKLAETNSLWALSLNKIRQAQQGNRIPVVHSDPHYNEAEWERAFAKASPEEQNKMLEERAKEMTKNK